MSITDRFSLLAAFAKVHALELYRTRVALWMTACVILALGLAYFIHANALAESERVLVGVAAPLLRLLAVFMTVLVCVQTVVREMQEKTHLNVLAQPISQSFWYAAKLTNACITVIFIAVPLGLALLVLDAKYELLWYFSLCLELLIVSQIATLMAITFTQMAAAVLLSMLVYVAGRISRLFVEIATRDQATSWWQQVSSWGVQAADMMLPKFDIFSKTEWLYGSDLVVPASVLAWQGVQVVFYVALVALLGWIDLRKREW
ncbi:MAG: hypothetical protein LW849_09260 [Burkholderiales bacterium]|nr:hypothetical protein [Burkholderiales bacterium]